MKRLPLVLLALGLPLTAFASPDLAAFNERITKELAAVDPEAAQAFTQANAARDAGDFASATALYGQVTERVPTFSHAFRRRCHAEAALANPTAAIDLCRKAVALERSAENLGTLALVLLDGKELTESALGEAETLSATALHLSPLDPFTLQVRCQVALRRQDLHTLRVCSDTLLRVEPGQFQGHWFQTFALLGESKFGEAREALDRARAAGLPEKSHQALATLIEENTPATEKYGRPLLLILAAWLGGFAVLLALGFSLSALALRAASRPPTDRTGHAVGVSRTTRRLYRAVLWLACVFYYFSMPLLLLLVVLVGGGVIYGFFALGHVPVKLVALAGILVIVTVIAILKSLFIRVKETDPGMELETSRHPRLARVLEEVAGKVGTRQVDRVFLTPGTDLAVFERGGTLQQLSGRHERCLILGAAVLQGMPIPAFKGILAHEYGHLSNEDTAGGGFAFAVRRSLLHMARALAEAGAAAWYNPAWLFLQGFHRVFLRISEGASRLQEVLADRWSALCYGAKAFETCLRHVIERTARFDAHTQATLKEVIDGEKALANLYRFVPANAPDEKTIEERVAAELNRQPTAYDSHPAPLARFAFVHALSGLPDLPEEPGTAWDLFEAPEELERAMTDQIRAAVSANHGIDIRTTEEKSEAATAA